MTACVPEKGPVLANNSGQTLQYVTIFEDGKTFQGELTDKMVLWLGHDDSRLLALKISDRRGVIHNLDHAAIDSMTTSTKPTVFLILHDSVQAVPKESIRGLAKKPQP